MPAAKVQDIVNAMYPILHISFLDRLPQEVCLRIMSFLDPNSLISLAQTSKLSSTLSSDWTLWQNLYYREGFLTNDRELREAERELNRINEQAKEAATHTRHSRPTTGTDGQPQKKKSKTTPSTTQHEHSRMDMEIIDVDPAYEERERERASNSIFNTASMSSTDGSSYLGCDDSITSDRPIFSPSSMSPPRFTRKQSTDSPSGSQEGPTSSLSLTSQLTTLDRHSNERRLNWQFLYNQRRRLEANWQNDKYVNYQIPHPDYPEEAHTQCIYAIQHDGRYLVSASRDRSVRIWSLDKCRLLRPPLTGHMGSVLCVQFDADPSQDIIISGSADHMIRIWQFSTGRCKQVIKKAHDEAILNLKFDDRILVTCSRDKTLRIFTRRDLYPGDLGYPLPEDFVYRPVPQVVNFPGVVPSPYGDLQPMKPFDLIGTLEGHGAAINACVIKDHEVVSVSGDRLAKIWDWPSQVCTRSLIGHTKGVAAVWYDGTRVVTSASDMEIKVFDRATGVEVASLKGPGGHRNLVRTVQAGFNDTGTAEDRAEEYREKAFQVDQRFASAYENRGEGTQWAMDRRSRRAGNPGSDRPEDIVCYGATLPPGGGGGKYARIISGSYDEMIIIWRRDHAGVWKPKTQLKQLDAARAALLRVELNRPPSNRTTELEQILATMQPLRPDQRAWHRELVQALVLSGPEALRQGISDPRLGIMEHNITRIFDIIKNLGGTIEGPEPGTRELVDGGVAIKNRMRAIVHAAMVREVGGIQTLLRQLEGDERKWKEELSCAREALHWAKLAEGDGGEDYRKEDGVWRRRLDRYKSSYTSSMLQSGRQVSSGYEDFQNGESIEVEPDAASTSANYDADLRDSNNFAGPPSHPSSSSAPRLRRALNANHASVNVHLPQLRPVLAQQAIQRESRRIEEAEHRLEGIEKYKESTRAHHRTLKRMLEEVDPPNIVLNGHPNWNAANHPAGQAGGGGENGGGPPGAGGGGHGGHGGPPGVGPGGIGGPTEWEGRVYKLQFDARRIVAASSNPIILVWDFANGDQEIEQASRYFRGIE